MRRRVNQRILVSLLLISVLNLVYGTQYKLFVYTGLGSTSDVFSVRLRGETGTTGEHVLRPTGGLFTAYSIKRFTISDKDVGKVIAVETYLRLVRVNKYFWQLLKVIIWSSSTRKYYIFPNNIDFGVMKHNQWLTISASCPSGFKKGVDVQCVDVNECAKPGACADPLARCDNTIGSFKCVCPKGYHENKHGKCEDTNECLYNPPCEAGGCTNTPGSYHCTCWRGFRLVRRYYCQDINECEETPTVCTSSQRCRNYYGGYRCDDLTCNYISNIYPTNGKFEPSRCYNSEENKYGDTCTMKCNHGYIPKRPNITTTTCQPNGWTTFELMECVARNCPPLAAPTNGQVDSVVCATVGGSYGTDYRCFYKCHKGYKRVGREYVTCRADGTWSGPPPKCILKPKITCPRNIIVILKPGRNTSDVSDHWNISSNVKTILGVSPPGVNSRYQFPYGATHVKLKAVNELGEPYAAICKITVEIKDDEPPKVKFCPPKFVFKATQTVPANVTFGKPQFTDNVGVHVTPTPYGKTRTYGGKYYFSAVDASGNSADCVFNVVVGGSRCKVAPEPPTGAGVALKFPDGIFQIFCWPGYLLHLSSEPGLHVMYQCNKTTGEMYSMDESHIKPPRHCVDYKFVDKNHTCEPGTVKRNFGKPVCAKCSPGSHYLNSTTCQACNAGFYQDKQGQLACKKCPAGTSSNAEATKCEALCRPGKYSSDGLGPFCKLCPANSYQHEHGKTKCNRCPNGTRALTLGATFCGNSPSITNVDASWSADKQDVTLTCYAGGDPSPSVYWSGHSDPPVNIQTQILDKQGKPIGTQLHIKKAVSRVLPATYKCTAGNPFAMVHRDLVVQTPQKSKKELVESTTSLNEEDYSLTLDAPVKAPCPPGHYSNTGLGPICKFCLKNMYQDQPSQKSCLPCAKGLSTTQLGASACGFSPVIAGTNTSSLTTIGYRGRDISMDCYANGTPVPFVYWTKKEYVPADFSGVFKQEQLLDKLGRPVGTRLTIRGVTRYNQGTYECEAVNTHGRVTSHITLAGKY